MNERIRELMQQSNHSGDFSECEWVFEKFAELIVRECLQMADEFELDVNRSGLVDRMKEHFGVEE